jgi:major membrane immunogen (membrane-anchored lipoprotein)
MIIMFGKKKILLYVVMVLVLASLLAACGGTKSITITNNGTVNYCELHVSKSGAEAYGDNQLPDGQTVTPGNKFDIPVTEAGDYDVRVVACDGAGEQVVKVNVP